MSPHPGEVHPGFSEIQTPQETLDGTLKQARHDFYDLPFDQGFMELCADRSIPQDATDDPRYWEAVADYTYGRSVERREAGEPEKDIVIGELLAATPDFLYSQRLLDKHEHNRRGHQDHAVLRAKETASYYNGLIRSAAESWPELRASELKKHMLNIANISIENNHMKHAASHQLSAAVRGAQHESAFGQILSYTGRPYRQASLEEDLHGIDYVLTGNDGQPTGYIDVKASLHDIAKHDEARQPYSRTRDGHLVMYSMVTDHELNDRFRVSDDVAAQRGAYLAHVLQDAETIKQAR